MAPSPIAKLKIPNPNSLVSVIVVNHNGQNFLSDLFLSVLSQTHKYLEIIMVDNNSSDKSVELVQKKFPIIKIIKNTENSGYAGGNNLGFRESRGEYILILNNDTILKDNLIEKLLEAFYKIPGLGVVQPMMRLMNEKDSLDACGSFWTNTGFNYHFGIFKNMELPIYNKSFPVYSLKGACMLMPRELIEKTGLFDDDFWCYFEETDFCNRVWLAGYECWYYPETYLYHYMGGTSLKKEKSFIQFHSFKNRLCSYLKNLSKFELFKILPIYFFINIIYSLAYLMKLDKNGFLAVYKSLWWNIKNLKNTLVKRKEIQTIIRKKSDREIFRITKKNPRISYYLYLFKGLQNYIDKPL